MTIRRTKLHFEKDFTRIPNEWVRDERLSRKARGLLVELMSHSINWEVTVESLISAGQEGRVAVRAAIKELVSFGYLERVLTRSEDGTALAGSHYELRDPQRGMFPDSHETRPSRDVKVTEPGHKEDKDLKEDQVTPEDQDAPAPPPLDPIIESLNQKLSDLIVGNGFPRPTGKKSYEDCRKMIQLDKQDPVKAGNLMEWACANEFWRGVIRSMAKFRHHYPSLRLQALAEYEKNRTGQSPDGDVDPDVILGRDYWQAPPPPPGLTIEQELSFKREAREAHRQSRLAEAKRKVTGNRG